MKKPPNRDRMAKKKGENYDSDGADDQDFDEEPNFDDPEGLVDDVTDDGKLPFHTCYDSFFFFLSAACHPTSARKWERKRRCPRIKDAVKLMFPCYFRAAR